MRFELDRASPNRVKASRRVFQVASTNDVVALEDRPGFVPGHLHRHPLRNTSAHQVPDCSAAKIVGDATRASGSPAGRFPRLGEARDGPGSPSAELEKGHAPGRVAELEAALAGEKAARTASEQKATRARVRDHLRPKALAVGAQPAAVEMLLDKGEGLFHVSGDAVVAKPNTFSRNRPGEAMTPEDWLAEAVHDLPFLFLPSSGGGASSTRPAATSTSRGRELRDPSPQDLGRYAKEIKSGEMHIVNSSDGGQ
jgi:hypothetical protein